MLANITIKPSQITAWRAQWTKLHDVRFKNDYDICFLLREVRAEFPKGPSGDQQYAMWVRRALKTRTPKTSLIDKAKATALFSRAEFVTLGGWPGITFLMGFTRVQRTQIIASLVGAGPFYRHRLGAYAAKLGFVTPRKIGRPTRSAAENKLVTLRSFIMKLYRSHDDLPTMPAAVQQALSPSILSAIPHQARA